MQVLLICLLGLYLVGLSSNEEVKLDEKNTLSVAELESAKPGSLGPQSIPIPDPCMKLYLREMISGLEESDRGTPNPEELARKGTVLRCKRGLETDITNSLAELDEDLMARVDSLVEAMIKANGGQRFGMTEVRNQLKMSQRSIEEGVLMALEERGVDLCSINSQAEFDLEYNKLFDDCDMVHRNLYRYAFDYVMFLDNEKIEPEPRSARWTRNTMACTNLYQTSGDRIREGAYDIIKKPDEDNMFIGKCLNILGLGAKKQQRPRFIASTPA